MVMKKTFALLLALTVLCGCVALAEETVTLQQTLDFDVTAVVPEGYTMQEDKLNDTIYLYFKPDEETKTEFVISLAHSDVEGYADKTLNELTPEDKQSLLDMMDDDFASPEIHDMTTEHGTQVYLINEGAAKDDDADVSYAIGFSLYKGYFVQIYVQNNDYDLLTQDDLDLAIKILSDIWFVDAK